NRLIIVVIRESNSEDFSRLKDFNMVFFFKIFMIDACFDNRCTRYSSTNNSNFHCKASLLVILSSFFIFKVILYHIIIFNRMGHFKNILKEIFLKNTLNMLEG